MTCKIEKRLQILQNSVKLEEEQMQTYSIIDREMISLTDIILTRAQALFRSVRRDFLHAQNVNIITKIYQSAFGERPTTKSDLNENKTMTKPVAPGLLQLITRFSSLTLHQPLSRRLSFKIYLQCTG